MDIQELVSEYEAARLAHALLEAARDSENAAILAKVQAELDAVKEAFESRLTESKAKVEELEEAAKNAVKASGSSYKGEDVNLVFTPGRASWNTKALDGYAVAHPEIEKFKTVGEPSVAVRPIKGKGN